MAKGKENEGGGRNCQTQLCTVAAGRMTEEESTEMVTATRSRVHRKDKKEGAEFQLHKWNSIPFSELITPA